MGNQSDDWFRFGRGIGGCIAIILQINSELKLEVNIDIEEIFNEIDSQLPWADLGPGSSGSKDGLTWVWESEYTKETS